MKKNVIFHFCNAWSTKRQPTNQNQSKQKKNKTEKLKQNKEREEGQVDGSLRIPKRKI